MISFKKKYLEMLSANCKSYPIILNGKPITLYTNNKSAMDEAKIDLQEICSDEELHGKTQPIIVVQYVCRSYTLIAYIWEWTGPYAYVYNCNIPIYSEAGSLMFDTVLNGCKILLTPEDFLPR